MNNGEPEIPPDRPIEVPPVNVPVDIPPGGPIEQPAPPSEVPPEPPIELRDARHRFASVVSPERGKAK